MGGGEKDSVEGQIEGVGGGGGGGGGVGAVGGGGQSVCNIRKRQVLQPSVGSSSAGGLEPSGPSAAQIISCYVILIVPSNLFAIIEKPFSREWLHSYQCSEIMSSVQSSHYQLEMLTYFGAVKIVGKQLRRHRHWILFCSASLPISLWSIQLCKLCR